MPRRWWPFVVVAVLALAVVLARLAIDRPLESGTHVVRYGYPLWFLEAETTLSPSPGWNGTVALNPWEYPTETHLGRLLASWVIVAALPLAVLWWIERRRGTEKVIRRRSRA